MLGPPILGNLHMGEKMMSHVILGVPPFWDKPGIGNHTAHPHHLRSGLR